jgi:uncharacterized protein (TIGR00159 family)
VTGLRWQGGVDFVVLVVAIYLLLKWGREARALRLSLTILALRIGALLARQLDLLITSWVLDASTVVTLLALLVIFQPELRRALMRLDVSGRTHHDSDSHVVSAIVAAAWTLAKARCGALIVIARKDSLSELVTAGVTLGGNVSRGILEAVFQKGSPLHDGAVIIEGDVVSRVSAILPLTQRRDLPARYGTRHRAALGLTERSDAVVIVVSEERGEVTMMSEGQIRLMDNAGELERSLAQLTTRLSSRRRMSLRAFRPPALGLKMAALALSALVWSVTFMFPGRSVRMRTVPVEFTDMPPGLTIVSQSTNTVQLWLRSNDFLINSVNLDALVARCDLARAHEGVNRIVLGAGAFDVPFGLRVEAIAPREVSVRLESNPKSGSLP